MRLRSPVAANCEMLSAQKGGGWLEGGGGWMVSLCWSVGDCSEELLYELRSKVLMLVLIVGSARRWRCSMENFAVCIPSDVM